MIRKRKRHRTRKDSVTKNAQRGNAQKRKRYSKTKVKQTTRRISGPRAAYEKLLSQELCMDLAGKFARKSAKQTADDIGSVRFNYERIALKFVCLPSTRRNKESRSLCEVLRKDYETDDTLRERLSQLDRWIRRYVLAHIEGEEDHHRWWLRSYLVSTDLMTALAKEYVRDSKTLMLFLSAAFKRWRAIYTSDSLWRGRLITQQIARNFDYNRKAILEHLQKSGVVPSNLTADQTYAWLSRIGQYLSRDQRAAAGKDFGFGRRSKLKIEEENRSDRNPLTAS
jgi:hypothetical protein